MHGQKIYVIKDFIIKVKRVSQKCTYAQGIIEST